MTAGGRRDDRALPSTTCGSTSTSSGNDIVDEVSLTIAPGEVLGLVGESGSGKTTVGLAVLGHARKGARIATGRVEIGGVPILGLDDAQLRHTRGELVSYVPQDPAPRSTRRCASSARSSRCSRPTTSVARRQHGAPGCSEVMSEVLLPSTPEFLRRYPHQLSGGQQQRVGLAMAFACRPSVIVLDEPTTGLDVSHPGPRARHRPRPVPQTHGVAALYVTHDLAVVANLADRVAVMYAGRVVEQGPANALFADPAHPYTRHLIAAVPDMAGEREIVGLPRPGAVAGSPARGVRVRGPVRGGHRRVPGPVPAGDWVAADHFVRCFHPQSTVEPTAPGAAKPNPARRPAPTPRSPCAACRRPTAGFTVVHDVDLHVDRGECLALVGESGSGKTTVSRGRSAGCTTSGPERSSSPGTPLARSARQRAVAERLKIQYVFQNPYSSLNPRRAGRRVRRPDRW